MKFWVIMLIFCLGCIASQVAYQYGNIIFLLGYLLGLLAAIPHTDKRQGDTK